MRSYGIFYNRTPVNYSTAPKAPKALKVAKIAKVTKDIVEYDIVEVFAAAVAAQRINDGKYLKEQVTEVPNVLRDKLNDAITGQKTEDIDKILTGMVKSQSYLSNKVVMRNILNGDHNEITDADRNEGQLIKDYWQLKIFDSLSGRYISPFMKASIEISSRDKIKSNDFQAFGLIASMPDSYSRYKKNDEFREIKEDAQLISTWVGKPGENFIGEVKIIDCKFSKTWGCFYINAIQDSNLFMWSSKKEISVESVIKITGRIKAHRDNNVTQLNYVKIKS